MFSLSRFEALFQYLSREVFQRAVDKHDADRYSKSFRAWDLTMAMVYAQLAGVQSLRELVKGFNQHRNHHYHLATGEVSRSTLADANRTRNPQVFAEVVRHLMGVAGRALGEHREELLYLLDSTSIPLRGRGSQWTKATATRTPGLKLHILIARDGLLPLYQSTTHANVNDVNEARKMPIEPGATYVFDKGYCDYAWWARIAEQARFVTRLKSNAAVQVQSTRAILAENAHYILSDCTVRFVYTSNRGKHRNHYEGELRRIKVTGLNGKPLVIVTNDLESDATEIARLYKERWQIELFFKWIKQHLKVKQFLGESENAVRIQLLTALIAYLLVVIKKAVERCREGLWEMLQEIRTGLFQREKTEESLWRKRRKREAIVNAVQHPLFR
jgi:putative transposase